MKIQYISDLHLEFPDNRTYIEKHPIIPSADYLVIAGDTGYLNLRRKNHIYEKYCDKFFEYCNENWQKVIVVPGNHEWYGGANMCKTPRFYDIYPNVKFLNNCSSFIETGEDYNILFYGATLWSNIPAENICMVAKMMNDYRYIKYSQNFNLTPGLSIEKHLYTVNEIETNLSEKDIRAKGRRFALTEEKEKPYKLVIVTHHGCHPQCIDKKYSGSAVNNAYYTDLRTTIDKLKPEAWIFGHTHHTQAFTYDETIIAENSLGYVAYGECKHFKHDLVIDI